MRILHINRNYIFNNLHQVMIDNLSLQKDIMNDIFVPICKQQNINYDISDNVVVKDCFNLNDRYLFDFKQYKITKALEKTFDIHNYDCIHAYTLFTDGNCARNLSLKYNIPYIVAIRNTDVNDFYEKMPFLRKRGIKIMQSASAICFLSNSYFKKVFDKFIPKNLQSELKKKVYIIPNGVDRFWLDYNFNDSEMKKSKIDKSKTLNVIYAGRIDKNKNILTTQRALAILRKEGYITNFTVVGKVENQSEYDLIIRDEFTNYIPELSKKDLINEYRKNDLFIMPSFTESFGLTYVEAMSQGLPVIYTEGQGFDDQFKEGVVGFHVDPYSPESICFAIKKILKDYVNISNNSSCLSKRYDWSILIKDYIKIYQKIIY